MTTQANIAGEINVRAYGATGDGATDDTTAINAAIAAANAAGAGTILRFPPGDYLTSDALTAFTVGVKVFGYGATISEDSVFIGDGTEGNFSATSVDGIEIHGLTCAGAETIGAYTSGNARPFVRLSACTNVRINDVSTTGKTMVVYAANTDDSTFTDIRHTGILPTDPTPQDSAGTSAIELSSSDRCTIDNLHSQDSGSSVLLGLTCVGTMISSCKAKNHWDNGIYGSSANSTTISDCYVKTTDGSGIKIRGSNNTITGCVVDGDNAAAVGITIAPVTSADALGYGCNGNAVVSNTINNCNIAIRVDDNTNIAMRDAIISNNTIEDCGAASKSCIDVIANAAAGHGNIQIRNNSIEGSSISGAGQAGIKFLGLTGGHNTKCVCTGNLIRSGVDGIKAAYCDDLLLKDNYFIAVTGNNYNVSNSTLDGRSDVPSTVTLGAAATALAVHSGILTVTGDGGGNTIATITGGVAGQHLTLLFVDGLVTITDTDAHTADTVDLAGAATDFTSADDTVLQLVFDGNSWYEVSRSVN